MGTAAEPKPSVSVWDLLERRYEADQGWLLFYEVANGTGYKATNYADALAMSVWPSRGIQLLGFEVKASRSDLIKELRDEKKAQAIQKYCHNWFLVVTDAKLVDGVEVPPTWGILAPRNQVLHQLKPPTALNPEPWKPEFIAAMMRRFHEAHVKKDQKAIKEAVEERAKQLARVQERQVSSADLNAAKRDAEHFKGLYEATKRRIEDFEAKSGIPVNNWQASNIGELLQALQHQGARDQLKRSLSQAKDAAERISKSMKGALINLEQMETPKVK